MTTPTLALFDIDGTLIASGGAGARAWRYAFDTLYGVPADITSFSESGDTDPVVARRTFAATLGRQATEDELGRLFAAYLQRLAEEVQESDGYLVLEGVEDLLAKLADAGTLLGIVSGAMEGAARVKLSRANLNRFFVFGGYGSDSDDRAKLTQAAIDKAAMMHDHVLDPSRIFVVGDTPRDVAAAKAVGAVSVAVASGLYSVDQLRGSGADHVLESLASPFPAA